MQETTDDNSSMTSSTIGGAGRYPDYTNAPGGQERKYSGLEAAAAAKKQREKPPRDSIGSRYSADPLQNRGEWGN